MKKISERASRQIMASFLRMVNNYNTMEKTPRRHGGQADLYHSERHMLDSIASNAGLNVSEHAKAMGVTKGAISQVVNKLEAKGLVRRYRKGGNDREVFLKLTKRGEALAAARKQLNDETLRPLMDELDRHSAKEIAFLVSMFRWLDTYMEESGRQMKEKHRPEN